MLNRSYPSDLPRDKDPLLCHIFLSMLWSGHRKHRTVGVGGIILIFGVNWRRFFVFHCGNNNRRLHRVKALGVKMLGGGEEK